MRQVYLFFLNLMKQVSERQVVNLMVLLEGPIGTAIPPVFYCLYLLKFHPFCRWLALVEI